MFELTAEVMPDVCAFVFALIFDASDVEAARIAELVFEFTLAVPAVIAEARDDDEFVTS